MRSFINIFLWVNATETNELNFEPGLLTPVRFGFILIICTVEMDAHVSRGGP